MAKKRGVLIGVLAGAFIAQAAISQSMYPTWKRDYSTGNTGIAEGLSVDQLLASMSGLRQMVAGILWVQCDEYFHNGQFDAILPLIRLITWLDPRQMEVYSSGAWHIAYNFTDEQNRSDRRYIPIALRLLEEGVVQNPETYRLFHETGWIYYHKVDDNFPEAVRWFEQSVQKPDVLPALRGILANAYLKAGQLDKAVDWYAALEKDYQTRFELTGDRSDETQYDVMANNLNNLLIRMTSRGVFGRRAGVYDEFDYDTHNPVDLNFTVKIEVLQPKVVRVSGTWGIPATGARIRCVIRDKGFEIPWEPAPSMDFELDKGRTYMLDSLYTQNNRFDRKIDMSRNPTMYPFKADTVVVEFMFNPRTAPHHIQDKVGWDGEGMTDKRYYVFDKERNHHWLYAAFEIPRDMILRRGNYRLEGVLRSEGFIDVEVREQSDVIERIPRAPLRN